MSRRKLKTIAEVNEERQELPVHMAVYKIIPEWKPTGIESGLGGELLKLFPQPHHAARRVRVRCSHTGKEGYLLLDGTIREIIQGLEWDD